MLALAFLLAQGEANVGIGLLAGGASMETVVFGRFAR